MKWTKEKPKITGLYWLRNKNKKWERVVTVTKDSKGKLWTDDEDCGVPIESYEGDWWSDKSIEEPEEP